MLNQWSLVVLLAGALAGYTFAGPSLQAQSEPLPFTVGETVTIWYAKDASPPSVGTSVECTVEEIRGAFVKCGRPSRIGGSNDGAERWFTLKYVVHIVKRER